MEIQIQIQEDADAQVFGRAAIINFQSVLDQGSFNTLSTLKLYLDFNFNFNTLSTPTPPQPACATITVRHTFTGQLSVHLFSSHSVETSTTDQLRFDHCTRSAATAVNIKCATMCVVNRAHCALCTQCVHLEALGLCSWWQASQAKAHQQFIVMAPTTPTTRHYSLELLLAQHTVRTPTICNTR